MKKLGQYNSAPVSAPVGGTFYPTIFFCAMALGRHFFHSAPLKVPKDGVRTPCPAKIWVLPRQNSDFAPLKMPENGVRTRLAPLAPLAPQKNTSYM